MRHICNISYPEALYGDIDHGGVMDMDTDAASLAICDQWPLLLTWFNFNPSMDK